MGTAEVKMDADEVRRRLYDVMRSDGDFSTKASRALELGSRYLAVEKGAVSHVERTTDYWTAVESTDPPGGEFAPGCTLDLGTTFCRHVIEDDAPLSVHDAVEQGYADDPAVETLGLRCYQGAPITVGDEIFGTVCFGATDGRDEPFSDEETMFTDLVARMLGDALERERHEAELADRERLIGALNRVLRHNLRNDLNVVQGRVDLLSDRLPADAADDAAIVTDTIDDLLQLGEKARRLERLLDEPVSGGSVELRSLTRRLVDEVGGDHPSASFDVDGPTDEAVSVPTSVEPALREVLENAAKHAGAEPRVSVSLSVTDDHKRIRVADDGPGLPEQERAVLRTETETPLEHGSGLGLWLVYWSVSRLGGTVEASASERGTTVSLSLPHGARAIRSAVDVVRPDEE